MAMASYALGLDFTLKPLRSTKFESPSRGHGDLTRSKKGKFCILRVISATPFRGSGKHVHTPCRFAVTGSLKNVENPPLNSLKDRTFVPKSDPPTTEDVNRLHELIVNSKNVIVMTGAGISTMCGIPDFRGPNGVYSSGLEPITHQQFIRDSYARNCYWLPVFAGWRKFKEVKPGAAHTALASLENTGRISLIITQNIDGLHHRAGSSSLELHGTMHTASCVDCGLSYPMESFLEQLDYINPKLATTIESLDDDSNLYKHFGMNWRPDDGTGIDESFLKGLLIPTCANCSGVIKPNVVFFGDNIPKDKANIAMEAAKASDVFLVLGSSLMTPFALRLVRAAFEGGAAIAIVNIGKTGADAFAHHKIEARVEEILPRLLNTGSLGVPVIADVDDYDTKYTNYMAGN